MEARPVLSRTQVAVLDAIRTSVRERGYPPTLREVGAAVGLASSSSVAQVVQTLEARGYLHREPGSPRSLTIVDDPSPGPGCVTLDKSGIVLELSRSPHFPGRWSCPGCGTGPLQTIALVDLAYVYEVCTCRKSPDTQYDHLVEQLWHRACLTRSACADQS